MLEFLFLSYVFGPVAAIPYALNYMNLSPGMVYLYLACVYIIPLPLIFGLFRLGNYYRRRYRSSLLKKFSRISRKHISEVMAFGDEIQQGFEERLGHLGFYGAISVFTFLFGIFWASLFAYILGVDRSKAIISIAAGVLFGNAFWLLVILNFLPLKTPVEVLALLAVVWLVVYGWRRETEVIKKIASAFRRKYY